MSNFSSYNRETLFQQINKKQLDLLVIGGGITGAGIALDAVTRGLSTAVVEMQDFAAGTSSRSTKLIHGGLRYLKQFEVKVVSEVGKERAIVYENGPHVTMPEWMMLPFYKGGNFGPYTTNIGLRAYDFLAGVKKNERRKMLNPEEAMKKEPLVKAEGLKGAGFYVEYKTDDARLTIEVLKKAVQMGAHAINYAKVVEFLYHDTGSIIGAIVEDQITGVRHSLYAKKLINAGGPWVDELREIDGSREGKSLHLTKGVHLVFSKERFPLQQAVYFDAPDGRMIFAIPRDNVTYVGTTDTNFQGDISHPVMTAEDREYLLDTIKYMFPSLDIRDGDIQSSWVGVRPLILEEGKDPNEISRKDEIFIADSGLISMAGGKLTGYRKMAEEAVDTIVEQLEKEEKILYTGSDTKYLPISGGEVDGSEGFLRFKERKVAESIAIGIDEEHALFLIQRYGGNIDKILEIYQGEKSAAEEADIDPAVFAELTYALQYEMAYKPIDFFVRRTGALFFDIEYVRTYKDNVIRYMAKELQWDEEHKETYRKEIEQLLYEATHPVE